MMALCVLYAPITAAQEQAPPPAGELDEVSYALGTQLAANAQRLFGSLSIDSEAFISALRDVLSNKPPRYSTGAMSAVLRRLSKGDVKGDPVKTSYALGVYLSQQIAIYHNELKVESFLRGVSDPISGQSLAVSAEKIERLLRQFVEQRQQERKEFLVQNKEKNKNFFAALRKKDNVKELQGDLLYETLQTGKGEAVQEGNRVRVHYTGTLIDGTEFDSSRTRGEPAVFRPQQVIDGWQIALTRMRVGDRWKLYIPPDMAYGDDGSPPAISPGAALIFDVELLEVIK